MTALESLVVEDASLLHSTMQINLFKDCLVPFVWSVDASFAVRVMSVVYAHGFARRLSHVNAIEHDQYKHKGSWETLNSNTHTHTAKR